MKKLILIMLAFVSPLLAAAEPKKVKSKEELFKNKTLFELKRSSLRSKPQQVKSYKWNEIASTWDVVKYTDFQYNHNSDVLFELSTDSSGNWLERIDYYYNDNLFKGCLTQVWSEGAWENSTMITVDYNNQNEVIKEEFKFWMNGEWVIIYGSASSNTFDPSTSIRTIVDSMYDGTAYVAVQKVEQFVNTNTQWVDSEIVYFPMGSSDLMPYQKIKYNYFASGLYSDIYVQIWDGTEWVNESAQIQYLWDNESRVTSYVKVEWINGSWELRSKVVHDYFSNKSLIIHTYAINMGIISNLTRSTYLNDDFFNQIESKYEQWDEQNSTWLPIMHNKYLLTYDSQNRITEKITQTVDISGVLVNFWREEYFNYTTSGIATNGLIDVKVYPNPCIDYISIELPELSVNAEVSITLRNLSGQIIQTQEFKSNKIKIDLDSYLSGLYVLEVKTPRGTESRKIVIQ